MLDVKLRTAWERGTYLYEGRARGKDLQGRSELEGWRDENWSDGMGWRRRI